jgi:hypothetical protein
MKITYESTLDDMVEPQLRVYFRSKSYQKNRRTAAISGSLIMTAAFWVFIRPQSTRTILLTLFLGVTTGLVTYVLTFKDGVKKRIRKYVAREMKDKPPCISEYTVTEDKIVYTARNVTIGFLLSDLVSITEDPERVELFFGADKGLCVIPLRAFRSPEEKSLFLASLKPSPPNLHCP